MSNDDDVVAFLAAEDLALKCWDAISGDSVDNTELRRAAVDCLFSSRAQRTRSRLISAGRKWALAVLDYVDSGDQAAYHD